ncbi:MAG: hypothetical protein ACRDHZ_12760 [Ktedonobacteraceae bacterium]
MKHMYTHGMTRCVFGLAMVMALLLVAACSTTTGSNTASVSEAQQCGTVHTMRSLVVAMDWNMATGVEDCFWQAFQQCSSATLVYTQSDVEASTIHTFSLQSRNNTCKITDSVQHFLAPHPPQSPVSYICAGMQRQANGLHFLSCGVLGLILVPAVVAHT